MCHDRVANIREKKKFKSCNSLNSLKLNRLNVISYIRSNKHLK